VALRPKTFAVLVHLAERPCELVTKQALLDAVWGDVAVTEDVVRQSIGELRRRSGTNVPLLGSSRRCRGGATASWRPSAGRPSPQSDMPTLRTPSWWVA